MTRLAIGLFLLFGIASGAATPANAQNKPPAAPSEGPEETPPSDASLATEPNASPELGGDLGGKPAAAAPTEATATRRREDIVVVPRKAFLKSGRFEFAPMVGITVNDTLIRHYALGGELNYFASDVLWIGLEGEYFLKQRTDREALTGLQYNLVAPLNRYLWHGGLNFGYAPVYGKFSLFNRHIMHWEIYALGGLGATKSEIIPMKPGTAVFNSMLFTPEFGLGARFFTWDWLTINTSLRTYIFSDKFEPADGAKAGETAAALKDRSSSQLVYNIFAYVGVSFYLPTGFTYKTPR